MSKPELESSSAPQPESPQYDYAELARDGSPLPDEDSYRGEIADPAQRELLGQQEAAFAQHMADRARAQVEAADARHTPVELDDPDFDKQMSTSEVVQDPESGLPYSVFQLNNDREGRPLVVFLGLTTVAQKGAGRDIVHEFTNHVDRPLVVVEHEGAGKSGVPEKGWNKDITLKAMGESRLRVLDELARQQGKEDFGDFDVAGYSLGGSVALATAEAAGERAHQVVTIQTEGFDDNDSAALRARAKGLKNDAKTYKDRVEPKIVARNKQAKGLGEKPPKASFLGKLRALSGQVKVALTGAQSAQTVTELSPTTHWTTIVGSQDALTDWRGHLGAVRERNSTGERNSDVLVLGGDTHYSMKERRAEMAEMVSQVIERGSSSDAKD